jgi:hypothetical protein
MSERMDDVIPPPPADAALLREICELHDAVSAMDRLLRARAGALVMIPDEWVPKLRALAEALDDMRAAAWDIEKLAGDVVACVDSTSSNRRLHELARTLAVTLHAIAPPSPQRPA